MFYILKKTGEAESQILSLLEDVKVIATNHEIIVDAFSSAFKDKEDAIQYFTAITAKAKYLITRNVPDYAKASGVIVISPSDFLNIKSIKSLIEKR